MTSPGGGLVLQLILNTARAQQQLQRDMARSGRDSGHAFASNFRTGVGDLGRELMPAAGVGAAVLGFKKLVESAGSLNAAVGGTRQVFGQASKDIEDFGRSSASALGLSRAETLNYSKSLGALLQSFGETNYGAAKLTKQLVDAGASLAAFADTSVAEAQEAVAAGFRGEYDSLQKFLPQVSDAAIVQKALALGLAETSSKLTQANKATALSTIILESQQAAAGKAERSQGSLAISLDKTKAALINQAATLGNYLLPGLKSGLDAANQVGVGFVGLGLGAILLGRRLQGTSLSNSAMATSFNAARAATLTATQAAAQYSIIEQRVTAAGGVATLGQQRLAQSYLISATAAQQTALAQTGLAGSAGRIIGNFQAASAGANVFRTSMLGVGAGARIAGAGVSSFVGILGGPLGIALAVATLAIGAFMTQQSKQKARAEEAKQSTKNYAEAVAEAGGVINKTTRALAAKEIVDKGVAAQADRNGIAVNVLTDAFLGNKDAIDLINHATDLRIQQLEDERVAALGANDSEIAAQRAKQIDDAKALQNAVKGNNQELETAKNRQSLYAKAAGETSKGVGILVDTWKDAADALKEYKNANDELFGSRQSRLDAEINEKEAVDKLNASIKENGKSLDFSTEKGRSNVEAIRDRIQSVYDSAEAELQATGKISAATQKRIDSLRDEFIRMGFNKEQIDKILAAYKRLPPDVITKIKVLGGADAQGELTAVGKKALDMIATYNLTPEQAFALANGRDPRAVFGAGYEHINYQAPKNVISPVKFRAYGGKIDGQGHDRSDNQLVAASPDEYMIQAPSARKLGYDVLDFMNRTGQLPQFADGGRIRAYPMLIKRAATLYAEKEKALKAAVMAASAGPAGMSGPVGAGGWPGGSAGMHQYILQKFPGTKLLSGYRPGSITLTGNKSYHQFNRAVDEPARREIAQYIHDTVGGRSKEIISPWQDLNIHNGRQHTYTGAVWNQHNFAGGNAHVHWAYDQGGMMNPGDIGGNYGRRPEAVLDDNETERFKALVGGAAPIRLDDYSIAKIAQMVSTRPAILQVDGRTMAEKVFDHLEVS